MSAVFFDRMEKDNLADDSQAIDQVPQTVKK